jgi:hypothetical protein
MSCDENIQALSDAATIGQTPKGSAAVHMQHCRQCQVKFQREQRLFAAIDNALRTRSSEGPRPGFLARASARLSNEPTNNSSVSPAWAAVPVLVLALLASTRPWMTAQQTTVAVTPIAPAAPLQQDSARPKSAPRDAKPQPAVAPSRESSNPGSGIEVAAAREPEVLVPPDEQKAFAQFVARVSGQDVMAAAVVSRVPDRTPGNAALPQVPSVDVAQLEPVRRDDSAEEIDGSE